MEFENALRLFFGSSVDHTESYVNNKSLRRKWLLKTVNKMMKTVDGLDTTEPHKAHLMHSLELIQKNLKDSSEPNWRMVCQLLTFSGRLLGYSHRRGARCYSPVYWQDSMQYYTFKMLEGGDTMQDYYDEKDAVSIRREVALELKVKGLDSFKIALVLNTTEYQIKKLLSKD